MSNKILIKKVIARLQKKNILNIGQKVIDKIPRLINQINKTNPEKINILLKSFAEENDLNNENFALLLEHLIMNKRLFLTGEIKSKLKILINQPPLKIYLKGLIF